MYSNALKRVNLPGLSAEEKGGPWYPPAPPAPTWSAVVPTPGNDV